VTYRSPNDIGYHAFSSPPATPAGTCAEPATAPVAVEMTVEDLFIAADLCAAAMQHARVQSRLSSA
jgi:hypothetical protein